MLTEEDVRERLLCVIGMTNAYADVQNEFGEMIEDDAVAYGAIGFATGARFVRDLILEEFDFLFADDEDDEEVDDGANA